MTDLGDQPGAPVIYICIGCGQPTYFIGSEQTPGPVLGSRVVSGVPEAVNQIYEEARMCTTVNAFTACVLTCRILLTHLAVERGAGKSITFRQAVDYLIDNEDIPKNSREWVDFVRLEGNRANHELVLMAREEARQILSLVEMALCLIYEYPARIKKV